MPRPERLPPQPREWIDRARTVRFTFEGHAYQGYAGDTVTSALLANGVTLLGRSFKYHRPRGAFSLANHDTNVLLQSAQDLNLRGDVTPIAPGLALTAVNTQGGLRHDRGRFTEWLAPMLPVGFYYKTFHKPGWMFPFWERLIRRRTGLGRIDAEWSMPRPAKRHAFCDVLVVGAGPTGLVAALTAAEGGARVVLVDEQPQAGGSLGYAHADTDGLLAQLLDRVRALPNIELRCATVAAGYYADHWVPLVGAEGMTKLRAHAVIVASGAVEQPAVFRGNDLPGVMLASAAQRLIHHYAVKPCARAVVFAANDDGYRAALDLADAGVEVRALVDAGDAPARGADYDALIARGIEVLARHAVYEAEARAQHLARVHVCPLDANGDPQPARARSLDCDGLFLSVGWAPAAALLYQAGARMRYAEVPAQFVPAQLPAGVFAAGRVNGVFDLDERFADGRAAAVEALAYLGATLPAVARPPRTDRACSHPYPIYSHPKGWNFVDLDEDLQLKDLERAAAEGFDNIELLKRYSTVGMGPSQGKHANMNAVRVLARINDQPIDATGTTTARPFYHPVPLKHLAGRRLRPERVTPMHAWHAEHDAEFMHAGHWLRPKFYGPGPEAKRIAEEVLAVREGVGLIDVSTLGKIEVFGADAGEFLDRCYTLRISNMKLGMTRYLLMVDESGVVVDDGIAVRLGDEHFYVTTTTTGAEAIFREMQRRAAEWGLRVDLINRTGQNAGMNLAGPLTREVLSALTDVDLSQEAFPFLGAREGRVAGVPALLMRVGFVGELGYEIHVPASRAQHVWTSIMNAGRALGIRPFGVEAQRQLRLEKGHLIVSQDTDGTSSPFDANMAWAVKFDKPFFIGKRSLQILKDRARNRLVGFAFPLGYTGALPKECHLVIDHGGIAGRVTSIGFSPSLGRVVGLAMVTRELENAQALSIRVDGGVLVQAPVVPTPFYDPDNLRQKAPLAAPLREETV